MRAALVAAGLVALTAQGPVVCAERPAAANARTADFILAVVNQELVTSGELEQRLARVRETALRSGADLPPESEMRRQILEALIDERVQLTYARESTQRVEESELDRAVQNVAAQNQVTMAQLRQRWCSTASTTAGSART